MKDQVAFDTRQGICYIDQDGTKYTYRDFIIALRSEEDAKEVFASVDRYPLGTTLYLLGYRQCPLCHTWSKGNKKDDIAPCRCCRPLRTMGKISVASDPFDDDRIFFKFGRAIFKPGFTTLVGCNGCGKTTMLHEIKESLRKKCIPFADFNNLNFEGGQEKWKVDLEIAANSFKQAKVREAMYRGLCASEGEKILDSLISFTESVLYKMQTFQDYPEFWVFLDAIDSGLSMDIMDDIKRLLIRPMLEFGVQHKMDIYVICASNSWEMSVETDCFSIRCMRYVALHGFEGFRREVLKTRTWKILRDNILRQKAEIASLPYVYHESNKRDSNKRNSRHGAVQKEETRERRYQETASMELGGYRLTIEEGYGWEQRRMRLYKKIDSVWVLYKRYANILPKGNERWDGRETLLHQLLVRIIFMEQKKKK